jgi:hypothetical protein
MAVLAAAQPCAVAPCPRFVLVSPLQAPTNAAPRDAENLILSRCLATLPNAFGITRLPKPLRRAFRAPEQFSAPLFVFWNKIRKLG